MEIFMTTLSDYPKTYRIYLGRNLGNAMKTACKSSGQQLTWTWYGNIAQANEAISYCIEKITLDD